ncbi:unnamed protein product [Rotaria magnacalcarata]|uniref:DED domain-containing protein n=2 Tax=Rotaria magnacalcarata TaxID=392030 RepID=A0A816RZR6_9BILA|nr:unnamed protein product [Rotaria magnacalcarata]CAF2124816.1 unnamed protein product [Rotaria magnacalcarata]CAF3773326.1 unnamed protein product [Rotaria magnacalcarata]CAF3824367.1 unnamed protein product [Rotaria magnacalcarata]CAF3847309.1 unnamed protein product [Rotaria magnacalcarata]
MNAHDLRAILLKLQDRLKDDDRKRLHFFFGNDVPRRIRDDPSLGGTLSLMESLFDQDKINEEDFTFLIHAFEAIQCVDAAKLLREHMRQIKSSEIKKSMQSLAEIMPITMKQIFDDQDDDKYGVQCHESLVFFPEKDIYENNTVMNDTNDKSVDAITTTKDDMTTLPLQSKRKPVFSVTLIIWICLVIFFVILIIIFGAVSGIYLRRALQNNAQLKENILAEIKKSNETIQRLINELKYIQRVKNIPKIAFDAQWSPSGETVAGGNGIGSATNQLQYPWGLFVDDDQSIIIADFGNHRIVQWKKGDTTNGQVVAGGKGEGNGLNQLNGPTDVLIDKETDSLIICDRNNQRVVRWHYHIGTTQGKILIDNITCNGLAMDDLRYLYVSDIEKHEVRRYQLGDRNGTLVAGGNGQGADLNQLNHPYYIFVDRQQNVYVSDNNNDRVVKWVKGAKDGILVVGGHGQGNGLTQLLHPLGLFVDTLGTLYVADQWNHRVIRWPQGAKQGIVTVGGNRPGAREDQFHYLYGLSFDRNGNLYVVDQWNHRVQRFSII